MRSEENFNNTMTKTKLRRDEDFVFMAISVILCRHNGELRGQWDTGIRDEISSMPLKIFWKRYYNQ